MLLVVSCDEKLAAELTDVGSEQFVKVLFGSEQFAHIILIGRTELLQRFMGFEHAFPAVTVECVRLVDDIEFVSEATLVLNEKQGYQDIRLVLHNLSIARALLPVLRRVKSRSNPQLTAVACFIKERLPVFDNVSPLSSLLPPRHTITSPVSSVHSISSESTVSTPRGRTTFETHEPATVIVTANPACTVRIKAPGQTPTEVVEKALRSCGNLLNFELKASRGAKIGRRGTAVFGSPREAAYAVRILHEAKHLGQHKLSTPLRVRLDDSPQKASDDALLGNTEIQHLRMTERSVLQRALNLMLDNSTSLSSIRPRDSEEALSLTVLRQHTDFTNCDRNLMVFANISGVLAGEENLPPAKMLHMPPHRVRQFVTLLLDSVLQISERNQAEEREGLLGPAVSITEMQQSLGPQLEYLDVTVDDILAFAKLIGLIEKHHAVVKFTSDARGILQIFGINSRGVQSPAHAGAHRSQMPDFDSLLRPDNHPIWAST
ncbi:MAG: hypothetical protein MHM6MM_001807 [Cercozoa sp. M6MM]